MPCSVTIQNITATAQGGGAVLHITVTGDACKEVEISVTCNTGERTDGLFPLLPPFPCTVTCDLAIPCPCGSDVFVEARCSRPGEPNCGEDQRQYTVECGGGECCPAPQITFTVGDCDATGHRPVTFTTIFTLPASMPPSCLPQVGQFQYGDGAFGPTHVMTGTGAYTFTETHLYNSASSTTYTASFVYSLPNCEPVSVPVSVRTCAPPDCCAQIRDVQIVVGDCGDDCKKAVTITTIYAPPVPGCPAKVVWWNFTDAQGNAVGNSSPFSTALPSPNQQTFHFDPADSPITATLAEPPPSTCAPTARTIELGVCNTAPACPVLHSFTAEVKGCERVGDRCERRVDFTLDADFFAGCGANAGTKIEIAFGDGDSAQWTNSNSGHQVQTITHHYQSGGNYTATVTVLDPAMCLGTAVNVDVPDCTSADCGFDTACPDMPEPPSWCLCRLCYIFSQKPGKWWCKAIIILVASYISLAIVAAFLGWNPFGAGNTILESIGIAVTYFLLLPVCAWYEKLCSACCLSCALLLGAILAIIAVIIMVIYGAGGELFWYPGLVSLVGVLIAWCAYDRACRSYAEQSLTPENWCKD